jgi:lysophospholipase L1-like esterase
MLHGYFRAASPDSTLRIFSKTTWKGFPGFSETTLKMKKVTWALAILNIGVIALAAAQQIDEFNKLWHSASYNPRLMPLQLELAPPFPQIPGASIVMLGDSLTASGNWGARLQRSDVANRGIAGDTSAGILRRLEGSVQSAKIVFLLIGINDPAHSIPESESQSNIADIINELGKTRQIVVQSVLLTRDTKQNTYVLRLNQFAQGLCDAGKCTYVDLNTKLSENGVLKREFAIDDLHINADGYIAWASVIKPILDQSNSSLR